MTRGVRSKRDARARSTLQKRPLLRTSARLVLIPACTAPNHAVPRRLPSLGFETVAETDTPLDVIREFFDEGNPEYLAARAEDVPITGRRSRRVPPKVHGDEVRPYIPARTVRASHRLRDAAQRSFLYAR